MRSPLGRAYYAVAPFSPEPPYRLYAGEAHSPIEVDETAKLTSTRESEFTMLVPVKTRPVLVITEPSSPYNEVLALRMRRFSQLSESDQLTVRQRGAEDLFHLRPDRFPGLSEENAAIITTSLRLPVAALDTGRPLGQLDEHELRVIHERLVRVHQLDLRGLILDQARELVAALRAKGNPQA